jgi:ATP-dependent Clp protease protease subunit
MSKKTINDTTELIDDASDDDAEVIPDISSFLSEELLYNIFITDELIDRKAEEVCQKLLIADRFNQSKGITRPINLIINSPGGSMSAAWQICDFMDFIPTPVYTVGVGSVASAALVILMKGEPGNRKVSAKCSLMSHMYSWGAEGKHSELLAIRKEQDLTCQRLYEHYKECTGLDKKTISAELLPEHDVWLRPEEALKYHIVDTIIRSRKRRK